MADPRITAIDKAAYWRTFEYMYTGKYREEPCMKLNHPGTSYTPNHGTTMWVDSA
ncbi:hypothetical protein H633G_11550 [Metarhizium anisopliae BRIP 53284]|nr:hypothetical protein H633G_11550 [Metarhizium anisopliae BRIP 53284]